MLNLLARTRGAQIRVHKFADEIEAFIAKKKAKTAYKLKIIPLLTLNTRLISNLIIKKVALIILIVLKLYTVIYKII